MNNGKITRRYQFTGILSLLKVKKKKDLIEKQGACD